MTLTAALDAATPFGLGYRVATAYDVAHDEYLVALRTPDERIRVRLFTTHPADKGFAVELAEALEIPVRWTPETEG
jgi:hypothetical protein